MTAKSASSVSPIVEPFISHRTYRLDYTSYFVLAFGGLPGQALPVSHRRGFRIFFNVLNAVCVVIVTVRLVLAVSFGWRNYQQDSMTMSIFKANAILWKTMVVLQTWILTINGYRCARSFHVSFFQAVEYLENMNVQINWRREKFIQIMIVCSTLTILVCVNSTNLSTYDTIDPLFGSSLRNRTTQNVFSALYGFGWPTYMLYSIYSASFLGLFAAKGSLIILLLNSFNKKFSDEFTGSVRGRFVDVRRYRKAHNLLLKVVCEGDSLFSFYAGLSLLMFNVLLFLIIYTATATTHSLAENLSFWIWMMSSIGGTAMIVFIGNSIREKVSQPIQF